MNNRLADLFLNHDSKVADKWEQYIGIYDAELARYVRDGKPVRLLEVGIQNGGSLELWSKFLPEGSHIRGIDIIAEVEQLRFDSPNDIRVHTADATDPNVVETIIGSELFDIIIDDASHKSSDIIATFNLLFKNVAPGGKYIIEDLHCSYFSTHEGGYRKSQSSIEWLKQFVDSVNFDHIVKSEMDDADRAFHSDLNKHVARVSFYDSVAVIEKLPAEKEQPYRRICSGGQDDAFPFFATLSTVPTEVLSAILFAPDALKRIDAELVAARDQDRSEAHSSKAKAAQLQIEAAQLQTEAAQLQTDVSNAHAEIAALSHSVHQLTTSLEQQKTALSALDHELQVERAHSAAMSGSTSWRITRPIRWLGQAYRRFLPR